MKIIVLTIFPELFEQFFTTSLIGKAAAEQKLTLTTIDIRAFAPPPHRSVDDAPYGGGPGMVMKPEPLAEAIAEAKKMLPQGKVILLSPSGLVFKQSVAQRLSQEQELILIAGRYEGIDQRIIDLYVDEEISIGDYVLMGGEIPAMAIIEAVTRLVPGVLGNAHSIATESFAVSDRNGAPLEAPQYTRPPEFLGRAVPKVLLSGDHGKIAQWRLEEGLKKTALNRPDLMANTDRDDE
jgi:tRNA (guanine37-N1)-methyltransferase